MRSRLGVVVVVVALAVVLAGCGATPAQDPLTNTTTTHVTTTPVPSSPTTSTTSEPTTTTTTTTTPVMVDDIEDPANDTLGWEEGYWYNETVSVDRSDGLNESELDVVVARSMARVEHVRELEFEEPVPVEIINRSEFRDRTADRYSDRTDAQRLHQDVKFEALFFLGESESAVKQQQENTASSVLGFYSPSNHSIVIVSDNPSTLEMNEITLSQELFHAVQEKTFSPSNYSANTEELHNARDGIIEGDGNYVDHLYEERCAAGWDCLMPQSSGGGGSGGDGPHVGMLALRLQPYSDGPVFVDQLRSEGGWAAVNEVYEQPPNSTEQTIHPEKYRVDEPTNVTIEDRSAANWYVPDQGEGSIDYAQFGEAGVYTMLWYPSYVESQSAGAPRSVVIPYGHFLGPSQAGDSLDLYNYSHPYSAGWDGDKLLPYVRNDSAETNETGYVWKLTWDSEADAEEFVGAYEQLLAHHGAEPVPGATNTYRIDEGKFADAFRVRTDGRTVTIVNAPTVPALEDVHARPDAEA